jgi:hypothetical protein
MGAKFLGLWPGRVLPFFLCPYFLDAAALQVFKQQSHNTAAIKISVRRNPEWDNRVPGQCFDRCIRHGLTSHFCDHR